MSGSIIHNGLIMASGQNSKFSTGFSVHWNPKTAYSHSHTASSGLRTRYQKSSLINKRLFLES